MICPKCGAECQRDSVDVGVGVMHGPYGCPDCGWSESSKYDLTVIEDPVDERGGVIDQYGGYHPPGSPRAVAFQLARMERKMEPRHVTVYQDDATYCGWPANHGAWQWGDELLVGFMIGKYKNRGMHNIVEPFQKVLARSLDGGESWALEIPNVDFEATEPRDGPLPTSPGAILRLCGGYDHGGEYCDRRGGAYWSLDRGRTWAGPVTVFPNIPEKFHCTTRTCVIGDLVLASTAQVEHWGTDLTVALRLVDGHLGYVSEVLNDDYRAVMPAAARVGDRIVACLRRRGPPRSGCWVDAVHSDDNGGHWSEPVHVADTGTHNGNPPALVERYGVLYCAYANRSDKAVWVSRSEDRGLTWRPHLRLRQGECSDIGYPRLFRRLDGRLVCVYYWSENGEPQHIEATLFD